MSVDSKYKIPSFYEYSPEEVKAILLENGFKAFVSSQVLDWVYKKHVFTFDDMQNISKVNRQALAQIFDLSLFSSVDACHSKEENAIKNICELGDGRRLECVILKEKTYNTLCISSQIGCPVDCKFCLTGVIGFKRQLTTAEIVKQIIYAFSIGHPITNVVFMGMGEPLLNSKAVCKAIDNITDPQGFNFSKRNITVSTSGYIQGIQQLIDEERYWNLAFSVGSADPIKRVRIMPIESRNPIVKVASLLKHYLSLHNRKLTLEYTLLEGINDSSYDIASLINLAQYLNAKINLINLNPHEKIPYKPISIKALHSIRDVIKKSKCRVTIRYKKGQDITAACGQLGESYLT